MGIHADQDGNGSAQRRNLSQRKIDEDDSSFHNVHAEIGMNASQNEAGHEGPE